MKLKDLNPSLRARVRAAMASGGVRGRVSASGKPTVTLGGKKRTSKAKESVPNATEAEYNVRFLDGNGQYEAITLRLPGGSKYTPDWMSAEKCISTNWNYSVITLTEVKGPHRFPSEGRSRLAFDVARVQFPQFRFVWAKKCRNGEWEVSP